VGKSFEAIQPRVSVHNTNARSNHFGDFFSTEENTLLKRRRWICPHITMWHTPMQESHARCINVGISFKKSTAKPQAVGEI